jgi:hypothetical protein
MSAVISDAWFHRIKAATRDLVKACGGVVRAGEVANTSKSEVSRWQSATDPDVIGIPQALALEFDCGLHLVTTVMADLHGRRLTDPNGDSSDAVSVFARHAETVRAAAEVIATGATAQADGELTPAEAELMDRSYSELERAAAAARRDLASVKAGAGRPRVVASRG